MDLLVKPSSNEVGVSIRLRYSSTSLFALALLSLKKLILRLYLPYPQTLAFTPDSAPARRASACL